MLEAWQRQLLEELRIGCLGTTSPGGRPHLVPVCYAFDGDALVIPVDEKPKRSRRLARLRNIARDPRVSLLFDRYEEDWTKLAWVRIEGRASIVERGGDRPGALASLRARYRQYQDMALETLPLVVVELERVVGWRWQPHDPPHG